MTYEELEDRVRELESALSDAKRTLSDVRDELVKQRRLYEDNINNLDEDNFAANYRVQQGNRFSEIKQSAESIVMVVGTIYGVPEPLFGEEPDDKTEKTVLHAYYEEDKNGEYFPEAGGNYTFKYYYRYNSISKKWEKVDSMSVMSQFVQTVDGFKLSGHVVIDGNTYQNGNIYVTGEGINNGSAIYVCNGDADTVKGFISFDSSGMGDSYESKDRMLVAATQGSALKIATLAGGNVGNIIAKNISIGAGMWGVGDTIGEYSGNGYIYISSPIVFSSYPIGKGSAVTKDVVFQDGCRVDFSDAEVNGLYAVFE
jgi:hypothetical protein